MMNNDQAEDAGACRREKDNHTYRKEDRAMDKPMTLGELLEAFKGLDRDAPVLVGIINGPRFNAAYAEPQPCSGTKGGVGGVRGMAAYLCCYEQPRAWEWPSPPKVNGDGTATIEFNPSPPEPDPFG